MMHDEKNLGLYHKFDVVRVDNAPKHKDCEYFVLDLTHDPFALPAIEAYIAACESTYRPLADDLRKRVSAIRARLAPACPTCLGRKRHLDGRVCMTCGGK